MAKELGQRSIIPIGFTFDATEFLECGFHILIDYSSTPEDELHVVCMAQNCELDFGDCELSQTPERHDRVKTRSQVMTCTVV